MPLFRWALERWDPDPYEVVVFHRGAMSPAEQAAVDRIEDDPHANVLAHVVDLDAEPDEGIRALWEEQPSAKTPWMVVRYPGSSLLYEAVWSGPFNDAAVKALLDSPARREVARRILDGDAAAWVLLEIGDPEKDNAAAGLLQAQLDQMPESLASLLPIINPALAAPNALGAAEPSFAFSVVRVARDDPAEAMFVEMLLGSESDLRTFHEAMAFPVYGRGRALYALVGAGINEDTITEACAFLVAGCTCLVKDENPGVDILMPVDWESSVGTDLIQYVELAPLSTPAQPPVQELPTVSRPNIALAVGLGMGVAVVIITGATLVFLRKRTALRG